MILILFFSSKISEHRREQKFRRPRQEQRTQSDVQAVQRLKRNKLSLRLRSQSIFSLYKKHASNNNVNIYSITVDRDKDKDRERESAG